MIINGREIAASIYDALKREYADAHPKLGIIVANDDPVIESYVRIKSRAAERLGVAMERVDIPNDGNTDAIIYAIKTLAAQADGIVVQLPLRQGINTDAVLSAIPQDKDIDALNPTILDDDRLVHAPVAEAAREILTRSHVTVAGKKCVVIGAGALVGKPVAHLLAALGGDVSVITLETGSLDMLKDADVIVSGAGSPALITPEKIQEGTVLIDAGTSESSGKVAGDADSSCADKCSLFTPVPGGVGPVAVAMLFKNLFTLTRIPPESR